MGTTEEYFVLENKEDGEEEHLSPSGKYKLTVSSYRTKPGSWNYSRGIVTVVETGAVVGDIKRNYGAFPFTWLEGHANGHSYLLAGEDYQGQTVVELDTGTKVSHLSEGAAKGVGFCWADTRFEAKVNLLVVCGCHWACPYEYRFFDFTDPMKNGWAEMDLGEHWVDADRRWPTVEEDGTIKTYQSVYEDDEDVVTEILATSSFRKEGGKLVFVGGWVSEVEKANRIRQEEGRLRREAEMKLFYDTDPLYLAYMERLKDPGLNPENHAGIGVTYEKWCPDFKEQEQRYCRRILKKTDTQPFTVDLEWAMKTGPVKLVVFKDGNLLENKFWYDHSVESITAAFDHTKNLLKGAS